MTSKVVPFSDVSLRLLSFIEVLHIINRETYAAALGTHFRVRRISY